MSPSIYFIDREQNTTLQDIGVYNGDSLNVTGAGEPEHVRGLDVTDGTLPLLGVVPALGRLFTRQDDSPGAPETVLLSYGYWQKKFGGDRSVIGRSITVDGKPREIIGVLPKGFHFLDREDDALILPMQWDRSKIEAGQLQLAGPGPAEAGSDHGSRPARTWRGCFRLSMRSFPAPEGFSVCLFEKARILPNLRPLKQDVVGDMGNVLWVLMGSIAMVLLVACANVANLLLVRVEGRRQELAIRSALGAGWGRIAAELLFESVVLGIAGQPDRAGAGLWRAAPSGGDGADGLAAHSRDRHRLSGAALHAGAGAVHQPADRADPGHQVCRGEREQRSARRRPRAEPEPRDGIARARCWWWCRLRWRWCC